jgi:hypothetical protein
MPLRPFRAWVNHDLRCAKRIYCPRRVMVRASRARNYAEPELERFHEVIFSNT